MFGYIQPNKDELRFREYMEYRAYYCGLCKCIGRRFNELSKLSLSYDCTFLALFLSGMAGSESTEKCRCAYKPLAKPRMAAVEDDCIRFAADTDIILAYKKLDDDWQDEKKAVALAGKGLFASAAKKAKENNPELYQAVEKGMSALAEIEKRNSPELDAAAHAFAGMMESIALCAPVEDNVNRLAFSKLMFHLGRWVYLIDAWDDREKDAKRGCYNPFNAAKAGRDRAEFLINYSLNQAIEAYELVNITTHQSLLDNIMLDGCPARNKQVLGGTDEESL